MKKIFITLFLFFTAIAGVSATNTISLWDLFYIKLNQDDLDTINDSLFAAIVLNENDAYFLIIDENSDSSIGYYKIKTLEKGDPVTLEGVNFNVVRGKMTDLDIDYDPGCRLSMYYNKEDVFIYIYQGDEEVLLIGEPIGQENSSNYNLEKLTRLLNDRTRKTTLENMFN